MPRAINATLAGLALGVLVLSLAACSTTRYQQQQQQAAAQTDNQDLFGVISGDAVHIFYDRASYLDFLAGGATPYVFTRPGPDGRDMVFVLTAADQARGAENAGVMLMEGSLSPAPDFYGELRRYGRIYVFDNPQSMARVLAEGHPDHFYTQIAAGPEGETVVYVLDAARAQQRPADMIARFEAMHSS